MKANLLLIVTVCFTLSGSERLSCVTYHTGDLRRCVCIQYMCVCAHVRVCFSSSGSVNIVILEVCRFQKGNNLLSMKNMSSRPIHLSAVMKRSFGCFAVMEYHHVSTSLDWNFQVFRTTTTCCKPCKFWGEKS